MPGYLPDEFIDNLREQTDIVEVIGQHVELRRRGQNWVGLCPFHTEKTPSFTVTPSKDIFKCFGCGKGGDVYSFLMDHQQLSFTQAVEQLAERAGLPMPRPTGEVREDSGRKRLFYANEFARSFYHEQLTGNESGAKALQYLKQRGLSDELIAEFSLGWAPEGRERDTFCSAALNHGIEQEDLIAAGLVSVAQEGGRKYDRFRGRVLFPISDTRSRTVGFGGRVLDDSLPKYLNTSDTDLFHKGEVLFGLDKARGAISRAESALVVEGYMDLLSLWQFGVQNAVAPLGTALTAGQARLLGRYAREVFLLYDADRAGLKATFRGGDELLAAGVNVRVATLPGGQDPDDFIRSNGPEKFEDLLSGAVDLLDRKIEIMRGKLNLEVVSQRELAADKCLETVARVSDELVRELYLQKTAEFIGVPENVVAGRMRRISAGGRRNRAGQAAAASQKLTPADYLLAICMRNPEFIERVQEKLGRDPFERENHERVFEAMLAAWEDGVRNIGEALYVNLPEELHSEIARLRELEHFEPAEEVFDRCWRKIEIGRVDSRMSEIFYSTGSEGTGAADELEELHARKHHLQHEMPGAFWLTKK